MSDLETSSHGFRGQAAEGRAEVTEFWRVDTDKLNKRILNWFTAFSLILFTFFIPISPSLRSIFLICSLLGILLKSIDSLTWTIVFRSLWAQTAITFFIFIVLACLWSQASHSEQWMVVDKYLKLIYLPFLAVGFIHKDLRTYCINSYLLAIFITCLGSILKLNGLWFALGDPGEVFFNHIVTGFMVAFGAYLSALFIIQFKGWIRLPYIALFLFTSFQIFFVNTGRTGYIIYTVLMLLLVLQHLSLKKALMGMLFVVGLLFVMYQESYLMQKNMHNLYQDIQLLKQHQVNTSLGFRMQFHHYAKSLFLTHPLIGVGTGGFKYSFAKDQPVPAWGKELNEPHSQYWFTLAEQGLIGLLLMLLFLGSLGFVCLQLKNTKLILIGILIVFCLGAFSDTILCYSSAGFLLIIMSALALGELIENKISSLWKG